MSELHNNILGLGGSSTMIRDLIDAGYKWDTFREDVIKFVQECPTCQKVWLNRIDVAESKGVLEAINLLK